MASADEMTQIAELVDAESLTVLEGNYTALEPQSANTFWLPLRTIWRTSEPLHCAQALQHLATLLRHCSVGRFPDHTTCASPSQHVVSAKYFDIDKNPGARPGFGVRI